MSRSSKYGEWANFRDGAVDAAYSWIGQRVLRMADFATPEFTIHPAGVTDFELAYPLLMKFGSGISSDSWRHLFEHPWARPGDPRGYILFKGKEAKGFLGLIFSRRTIRGRQETLCNMTSWIVEPDCRNQSLSLLRKMLQLDGITITNFSASVSVARILERSGFEKLQLSQRVLLPVPHFGPVSRVACEFDERAISAQLNDENRRILADHSAYGCRSVLLRTGNSCCFLLLKPYVWRIRSYGIRARLDLARVHYASDCVMLASLLAAARGRIIRHLGVYGLLVDERRFEHKRPILSFPFPEVSTWLFKSGSLDSDDIDTLYSEMILLHQ